MNKAGDTTERDIQYHSNAYSGLAQAIMDRSPLSACDSIGEPDVIMKLLKECHRSESMSLEAPAIKILAPLNQSCLPLESHGRHDDRTGASSHNRHTTSKRYAQARTRCTSGSNTSNPSRHVCLFPCTRTEGESKLRKSQSRVRRLAQQVSQSGSHHHSHMANMSRKCDFDQRMRRKVSICDFSYFVSVSAPEAGLEELRTMCDWGNWVCSFSRPPIFVSRAAG